jgi:hypothetical protein
VSAAGVSAGKFITEWIKKAIPIFVPMVWK